MIFKLLGHSGLRVSELCLGTMAFDDDNVWGCDKQESQKIFNVYKEAGGNFIDTACNYGKGAGETIVGKMIGNDRDDFVVASKFGLMDNREGVNFVGTHRKNIFRSVEDSLKRLNTDYIDLLWLHCPDGMTPISETMRALDDLVKQGKVHYLGASQMSAWEIARANTIAENNGWTSFVAIQPEYNLLERTSERELIPMATELDLAITPWSPLAGGVLTGKYLKQQGSRVPEDNARFNPHNTRITQELVAIADSINQPPAQVALRWIMQKGLQMIPIVGAKKASQLKGNLGALKFKLSEEVMLKLNQISDIDLGYPHQFIKTDLVQKFSFGGYLEKVTNHRQK